MHWEEDTTVAESSKIILLTGFCKHVRQGRMRNVMEFAETTVLDNDAQSYGFLHVEFWGGDTVVEHGFLPHAVVLWHGLDTRAVRERCKQVHCIIEESGFQFSKDYCIMYICTVVSDGSSHTVTRCCSWTLRNTQTRTPLKNLGVLFKFYGKQSHIFLADMSWFDGSWRAMLRVFSNKCSHWCVLGWKDVFGVLAPKVDFQFSAPGYPLETKTKDTCLKSRQQKTPGIRQNARQACQQFIHNAAWTTGNMKRFSPSLSLETVPDVAQESC